MCRPAASNLLAVPKFWHREISPLTLVPVPAERGRRRQLMTQPLDQNFQARRADQVNPAGVAFSLSQSLAFLRYS
jgi:hypothetical protein